MIFNHIIAETISSEGITVSSNPFIIIPAWFLFAYGSSACHWTRIQHNPSGGFPCLFTVFFTSFTVIKLPFWSMTYKFYNCFSVHLIVSLSRNFFVVVLIVKGCALGYFGKSNQLLPFISFYIYLNLIIFSPLLFSSSQYPPFHHPLLHNPPSTYTFSYSPKCLFRLYDFTSSTLTITTTSSPPLCVLCHGFHSTFFLLTSTVTSFLLL